MEDKEIEKGNKIIAEFMGYKYHPHPSNNPGWHKIPDDKIYHPKINNGWYLCRTHKELKYHNSWNWLMPVIHKIENYKFEDGDWAFLRTFSNKEGVRFNRFKLHKEETAIQSAFSAVVDFIEQHNENNLKE